MTTTHQIGRPIATTKAVIDAKGNWTRIPMLLTRTAQGWSESPLSNSIQSKRSSAVRG